MALNILDLTPNQAGEAKDGELNGSHPRTIFSANDLVMAEGAGNTQPTHLMSFIFPSQPEFSETINAKFEYADVGRAGAAGFRSAETIMGMIKSGNTGGMAGVAVNAGVNYVADKVIKWATSTDFAKGAMAGSRTTVDKNAFHKLIFENMDIRTFEFSFTINPLNELQAANLVKAFYKIKLYSHPELAKTTNSLIKFTKYPAVWNIYQLGGSAKHTPKLRANCVLTSVSTTYGDGSAVYFGDKMYPKTFSIKMSVMEPTFHSRDSYANTQPG